MKIPEPRYWGLPVVNGVRVSGPPPSEIDQPPPPPASGVVPEAGFVVSGTLAENATITVTKAAGGFGTMPKFVTVGFGAGRLYQSALGSTASWGWGDAATYVCPFSTETLNFQDRPTADGYRRVVEIAELGGKRALHREFTSQEITWNCGEIPANGIVFMSALERATYIADVEGSAQWKHNRLAASGPGIVDGFTSGSTGIYAVRMFFTNTDPASQWHYLNNDRGRVVWNIPTAGNQQTGNGPMTNLNGQWTRFDFEYSPGTVDASDAYAYGRIVKPLEGTGMVQGMISSGRPQYITAGDRISWIGRQDYFQLVEGPQQWCTDIFWQVGTLKRFEITDAAVYTSSTQAHILPPEVWTDTAVNLAVWLGVAGSLAGKYLHHIDHDGTPQLVASFT